MRFLFFLSCLLTVALSAVTPISNGGTNSDSTLNNGRIMYSSSGKIVEVPELYSSVGSNLKIGQSGVSTATSAASKLVIQGSDSSQANGPHIQTYTSTDQYPVFQALSYSHGNIALCFECCWDDVSWKSSSTSGNLRLYKYGGNLRFDYSSGVSAGSSVSMNSAMTISGSSGTVTIPTASLGTATVTSSLYLPTSSGTADNLNYYEEYSWTNVSSGAYTSSISAKIVRDGWTVTISFNVLTGTVSTAAKLQLGAAGSIPTRFRPNGDTAWSVPVIDPNYNSGLSCAGTLKWVSSSAYFELSSCSNNNFSTGSGRGPNSLITAEFIKY